MTAQTTTPTTPREADPAEIAAGLTKAQRDAVVSDALMGLHGHVRNALLRKGLMVLPPEPVTNYVLTPLGLAVVEYLQRFSQET